MSPAKHHSQRVEPNTQGRSWPGDLRVRIPLYLIPSHIYMCVRVHIFACFQLHTYKAKWYKHNISHSSLNTQRACLLDNQYLREECGIEKEELYRNVSGLFLGIWCRLPLYQSFYSSGTTSHHHHPALCLALVLVFLLQLMRLPNSW